MTRAGILLRVARTARGRSLEDLADAVDITLRDLARIESGEDELSSLVAFRLCSELGLSPDPVFFAAHLDACHA